jgi:hypothetical protein
MRGWSTCGYSLVWMEQTGYCRIAANQTVGGVAKTYPDRDRGFYPNPV